MTEFIAFAVLPVSKSVMTKELEHKLIGALKDMYPTTQEVVTSVQQDLSFHHLKYPKVSTLWFHLILKAVWVVRGPAQAFLQQRAGRSTGLGSWIPVQKYGFYDAESRPHRMCFCTWDTGVCLILSFPGYSKGLYSR